MATKFLQKRYDERNNVLVFTLGDGTQFDMDPDLLPDDIKRHAFLHGLLQKIGDAASGYSRTKDYAGAAAALQATIETMQEGMWNRKGGGTGIADLVQALADVTGKAIEEAQAVVDGLDEDTRKALAKDARVKARVKEIQAERARKEAERAPGRDLAELFNR